MGKNLHIGDEIRKELAKQKRSIAWLAHEIGIDRSNLNKLLNKDHIKFNKLYNIATALQKDFFRLYSDKMSDIT